MSMNKTINMFIAFVAIMIIAFFAIGFTSTVQAPTNATELAQYNNLSKTVDIADTGINSTLLLIIIGMVFSAILMFVGFGMGRKRR